MKRAWLLSIVSAFALSLVMGAGCSGMDDVNGIVNCPSKHNLQPWGACSGHMECAWDLVSASPACDGTIITIQTSCICEQGVWQCPNAYACQSAAVSSGEDDSGDDASSDDGSSDDGGPTGSGDAGSE
jgi:hypothetical protein